MLLIKNANLDGTGKIVDILIGDDGKYKEIAFKNELTRLLFR